MAITQQTKLRIIEMRAEGLSYAKIAGELEISKQSVVDIAKESIDHISTLQAVGMEAFFEAERINKRGRIERLTALQARLQEEIEGRDLTQLPTDKLVTLFLKTTDALKNEVYTPTIQSTSEQEKAARERESFSWI